MPRSKDRCRAQAGTTLIELLVSLVIVGLALVLIVGTFSTALLDASLAKRNTAVQAVLQYELDSIGGTQFNASAQPYSECFATEAAVAPAPAASYQGACPGTQYTLRADANQTPNSATTQLWTVAVVVWPAGDPVGSTISLYKVKR